MKHQNGWNKNFIPRVEVNKMENDNGKHWLQINAPNLRFLAISIFRKEIPTNSKSLVDLSKHFHYLYGIKIEHSNLQKKIQTKKNNIKFVRWERERVRERDT